MVTIRNIFHIFVSKMHAGSTGLIVVEPICLRGRSLIIFQADVIDLSSSYTVLVGC